MARLEAILLVVREPVSTRRLAQWAGLADGTEARTLVRQLKKFCREEQAAITVEEIAGGFQLLTRPQLGSWLRKLYRRPSAARLSAPALETLAVTAYRQPVLRTEIEAIRGVSCGEILRQLLDRDLVRVVGRADDLGRPFLYGTSRSFLRVFGLRHLTDLPRWEALRRQDAPAVLPLGSTPIS
jgi:segregation and condensation protein B